MADPDEYDDPGPMVPAPPSRVRRALTVAILVMLIVSMVFLAFVSGRGVIRVKPDAPPTPKAQPVAARAASSDPVVEFPIHHVQRENSRGLVGHQCPA
jgi:hypothetical protein